MRAFAQKSRSNQSRSAQESACQSHAYSRQSHDTNSTLRLFGDQSLQRVTYPRSVEHERESAGDNPTGICHDIGGIAVEHKEPSSRPARAEGVGNGTGLLASLHRVLSSPGRPMDRTTTRFMESRLGRDFRQVRVHTDDRAAATARDVRARAYTVGPNIVFGKNQYAPHTAPGKRLLAHELTHTMQQTQTGDRIQRFAFCEPDKECPARVAGESGRAQTEPMRVEQQAGSIQGLLVGNFAISSGKVKADLATNKDWIRFASLMAGGTHRDWDILGFSDCHGKAKINKPLREQRAQAVYSALPTNARSKVNRRDGAPLQECMTNNADEIGRARNRSALIWTVQIAKPTSKPALAAVKDLFNASSCGQVKPGMKPAKADPIRACLNHSKFVNVMNQGVSNMKQVQTPYTQGLADLYAAMLKEVVKTGQSNPPTPTSPKTFTLTNFNLRLSKSNTITVPSISLKLSQEGAGGINGSYAGGVITLNETSSAAVKATLLGDQKEIERVMYAEGFHFMTGEVSSANRKARKQKPRGSLIREELDVELVNTYKSRFEAAVKPFWEQALKTHTSLPATEIPKKASAQAFFHWMKSSEEATDRLEEAIYLALRDGKGFTAADLKNISYGWVVTAAYWNPALLTNSAMQTFINNNRTQIYDTLVPIMLDIQKAYLRARPAS